jgi:hypothetical protein
MSTSSIEIGFGSGLLGARELGYAELVFAQVFVWGIGDAVSTLLALSLTGDLGHEANPLVQSLLAQEPLLLLVVKAGVAVVVGFALLYFRTTITRVPLWRTWMFGVLGVGSAIVLTNFYVGFAALA